MSTEDIEKRNAYIKLRSKMESILGKATNLEGKVENLRSALMMSLTIDDDIYNPEEFEVVPENINELISDINDTISTINSFI